MRLLQGFLFLVMPIGLTLSAAALAVWAWSEGWPLASVLLVSILLLAAAQILIVTGAAVRTSFPGRRYLRDIVQVLSGLKREIAALAGRVDVLEERARQPRRTVEPRLVQPAAEGGLGRDPGQLFLQFPVARAEDRHLKFTVHEKQAPERADELVHPLLIGEPTDKGEERLGRMGVENAGDRGPVQRSRGNGGDQRGAGHAQRHVRGATHRPRGSRAARHLA